MTANAPRTLSPEQLAFLQEALSASAALAAAHDLGVLDRLDSGPSEAAMLARACGIDERGAALLLGALAGLGLVEANGDGLYRRTNGDGALIANMLAMCRRLPEVIQRGRPVVAGNTAGGGGAFYPSVVPHLGVWFADAAKRAAERLHSPGLRVLDVGAGAATWSLALARRDPDCQVTAVDLPPVLTATRRAVNESGYANQYRYVGGDLFEVELGGGVYDLAIAGNICHLFDEAQNEHMLRRLCAAVRPGGRIAILDALPNELIDGPREVVLYALGLLWRTESGRVYPLSTYVGWLRRAGFEQVERSDLGGPMPISLVTARRAGGDEG